MIDPEIIDLEKRLLGDFHGRANIFLGDTIDNGTVINGRVGNNISIGRQKAVGKEVIHNKFPDEIEYYACAFEIVDENNQTQAFFSFPVMPNSINISKPNNVSIEKTNGGVVVHSNPTFMPFDISISGNFGKRFRRIFNTFIINKDEAKKAAKPDKSKVLKKVKVTAKIYSKDYKTGYGHMKSMESIIEGSNSGADIGDGTYKLIFYNLSFNQNNVVEVLNHSFNQSMDLNSVWTYNIQMKAVAPISAIFTEDELRSKNGSISQMLEFNRLNNDFANYGENIKDLLNPNSRSQTAIRRMLEKHARARALNLLGNKTKSGVSVVQRLVKNPNTADDFIVNLSSNLLNL